MIRWGEAGNGAGTVHMPQDDTARVQPPPTFPSRPLQEASSITGYDNAWGTPTSAPQQPQIPQPQPHPQLHPQPQPQPSQPVVRRQRKRKLYQAPQQDQQQQQQQQHAAGPPAVADRVLFFSPTLPSPAPSSVPTPPPHPSQQPAAPQATPTLATSTPAPPQTPSAWGVPGSNNGARASVMPQSPAPTLAPPPEGIYRSFEELLNAVQKVAKDQGYGVVKLRSSNYREGKPTRFDLVCDRGGVKYSSTAKKRNPTTRKVDCPWRGKAVCEVQLGNQWRFVVQEARHNHEPRIPALPPGQENTPLGQSLRKLVDKIDRIGHDMAQGFTRVETRLEKLEKRLDMMEQQQQHANGQPNRMPMMGAPVNMVEGRLSSMEARMNAMESRQNGMDMPMDEVDSRLLAGTVI